MKSHAQVAVIGGGVVGCSVLYHLTKVGWRDVVLVMRDFLETWEAHEQAKNRSIFLQHAGSRLEESL